MLKNFTNGEKMKKIKGFIKENYTLFISFFVTLFLYFLILILNINLKTETILFSDLFEQYSVFFNYIRDNILSGDGLFNSFSFSLGQNFYGVLTYFCLSPLNILLLFSSDVTMPYFILLLVLLKFGLSSFNMAALLKSKYGNNCLIILFSVLYGLMAYNLTYYPNIMWLDCVYLLPLIILGFEHLLKKDKPFLYLITLTLAIFSNYYIAFAICLFLIIYFIYYNLLNNFNKNQIKTNFLKFVKYSLLAVALSSVVLLPTIFNMLDGKFTNAETNFSLEPSYNLFYLLYKFIVGDPKIILSDFPLITSSILILVLLISYIFNKNFSKKDKIVTFSTIFILLTITLFPLFDTIMHCFRIPNQFSYRYAFVISFFLIDNAYKCFINNSGIKGRSILLNIIIGFLVYTYLDLYIGFKTIITILILILYYVITLFIKDKKILFLALIPIVLMELSFNIATSLNPSEHAAYEKYFKLLQYEKEITALKPNQNEFYRISGLNKITYNDSFNLNYYGIGSFSPTISLNSTKFLKEYLGLQINESYAVENLSTTNFTDSLLGLKYKYLITEEDLFVEKPAETFPVFLALDKDSTFVVGKTKIETQNNLYKYLSNDGTDLFKTYNDFELVNCEYENNTLTLTKTKFCELVANKITIGNQYYAEVKSTGYNLLPIYSDNSTTEQYGLGFILNITDSASIYISNDQAQIEYLKVYEENGANLANLAKKLNAKALNITSHNHNRVTGYFKNTESNQILFTTIPFDEGWHVFINGKEVKTFKNLDSLLAFDLPIGDLEIELYFIPKGFTIGLIISLSTLTILFTYYYRRIVLANKK